jgi:peptidoglycan/LPS O-acetylase OafA/YrhL
MEAYERETIAYRADIDGLRALAIISVILFHAFPSVLPGGFVGVDVFFVISGYLITSIIHTDLLHERFTLGGFYQRRVRRLFPSLLIVLFACSIIGYLFLFPDELISLGKYLISTNLYISNLLSLSESGYFDIASMRKPLLHTWSLSIEEQFYLFWPVAMAISYRFKSNLIVVGCILLLLSFLLGISDQNSTRTFYSPLSRIWELLSGCLLALANFRNSPKGFVWESTWKCAPLMIDNACSFLGIAGLVLSFTIADKGTFPGWQATLPVASAVLLIAGRQSYVNRMVLSSKLLVGIGKISYPLYLWHWPLLSFAFIFYKTPSPLFRLILVLISVILAVITYRFIETPLRKKPLQFVTTVLTIASLGLIGFGVVTVRGNGFSERFDKNTQRAFDQLAYPWIVQPTCVSSHSFVKDGFCIQSRPELSPESVIFGDSFAHAVGNGLVAPSKRNLELSPVLVVGRSGCMPFFEVEEIPNNQPHYECQQMLRGLLEYIVATPSIKRIFLVGRHPVRVGEVEGFGHEPKYLNVHYSIVTKEGLRATNANEAFTYGLEATLASLTALGKEVVFVHSVPEFDFEPRDCLRLSPASNSQFDCRIKRSIVEQRQARYRELASSVLKNYQHVSFFDPLTLFCDSDYCYPTMGGVLLYRDFIHVNADGALLMLEGMNLLSEVGK